MSPGPSGSGAGDPALPGHGGQTRGSFPHPGTRREEAGLRIPNPPTPAPARPGTPVPTPPGREPPSPSSRAPPWALQLCRHLHGHQQLQGNLRLRLRHQQLQGGRAQTPTGPEARQQTGDPSPGRPACTAGASRKAAPKGHIPWQGSPGPWRLLPFELPPCWVPTPHPHSLGEGDKKVVWGSRNRAGRQVRHKGIQIRAPHPSAV